VVDPKGNILAANPSAERLTGYSSYELMGRSCKVLNRTGCKILEQGEGVKWYEFYCPPLSDRKEDIPVIVQSCY
jgi:PAS domain-containing protein